MNKPTVPLVLLHVERRLIFGLRRVVIVDQGLGETGERMNLFVYILIVEGG